MHYNLIDYSSLLDIKIIFKLFSAVILSNSEIPIFTSIAYMYHFWYVFSLSKFLKVALMGQRLWPLILLFKYIIKFFSKSNIIIPKFNFLLKNYSWPSAKLKITYSCWEPSETGSTIFLSSPREVEEEALFMSFSGSKQKLILYV